MRNIYLIEFYRIINCFFSYLTKIKLQKMFKSFFFILLLGAALVAYCSVIFSHQNGCMPSSTCTECTMNHDYPYRTLFDTSYSHRVYDVPAKQSVDESCLYSTDLQTLWAYGGASLMLAVVAIVVANYVKLS